MLIVIRMNAQLADIILNMNNVNCTDAVELLDSDIVPG